MSNERAPIYSDEQMAEYQRVMLNGLQTTETSQYSFYMGADGARNFYEAKITSGELMVVKTVKFVSNDYDANIDCNACGWSICYIHVDDNPMKFCPGCGAKIIEA